MDNKELLYYKLGRLSTAIDFNRDDSSTMNEVEMIKKELGEAYDLADLDEMSDAASVSILDRIRTPVLRKAMLQGLMSYEMAKRIDALED